MSSLRRRGSSGHPARTTTRWCPRRLSRREPCRCADRSCGRSSGRSSCPDLLANFHLLCDAHQLIQSRALARDVLDVQPAVHLTTVAARPDDPADAQHAHMPRDPRLAHAHVEREIVDVFFADLAQALQDAEARGVGEGPKVVRKLVTRTLEKHKGSFIEV